MDVANRLRCNWIEIMSESFISNQSNGVQARMSFGEALWFWTCLASTGKDMETYECFHDSWFWQQAGGKRFGFWQRKACGSMACLSWREFVFLTTISKQFAWKLEWRVWDSITRCCQLSGKCLIVSRFGFLTFELKQKPKQNNFNFKPWIRCFEFNFKLN